MLSKAKTAPGLSAEIQQVIADASNIYNSDLPLVGRLPYLAQNESAQAIAADWNDDAEQVSSAQGISAHGISGSQNAGVMRTAAAWLAPAASSKLELKHTVLQTFFKLAPAFCKPDTEAGPSAQGTSAHGLFAPPLFEKVQNPILQQALSFCDAMTNESDEQWRLRLLQEAIAARFQCEDLALEPPFDPVSEIPKRKRQ